MNSPSPIPSPSSTAEPNDLLLSPSNSDYPKKSPRWVLILKARIWRFLARIGFYLHTFPKPSPPRPSFFQSYTTKPIHGHDAATLPLAFYVPPSYHRDIALGKKFPAILNFHGGGFILGSYSDDARWAAAAVNHLSAVVVSVTYRLAPEHPFPTAVEDGLCALLHLHAHASTLGIDPAAISLTGFSAGGNLAFTIPLRLAAYASQQPRRKETLPLPLPLPLRPAAILAWYPSLDNRLPRSFRRASNPNPSRNVPRLLTDLFDAANFPLGATSTASPFASPPAASDADLIAALPDHVALYLCESDMLCQEGREFAARLRGLGKRVECQVLPKRMHGFDRNPRPWRLDWMVGVVYEEACGWLREVLLGGRREEEEEERGVGERVR